MSSTTSAPDIADRHRRYFALVMLAFGFLSLANAAQGVVAPEWVRFTEQVQNVWALAVVLGLSPMIIWKLRNRDSDLRKLYRSEDGFVAQTLNKAKTSSWVVTFILIAFLIPFASRLEDVPGEVFLHLAMAVMTGVFGGVFLFLNRRSDEEDLGEQVDA